jgi:hypothetical protein
LGPPHGPRRFDIRDKPHGPDPHVARPEYSKRLREVYPTRGHRGAWNQRGLDVSTIRPSSTPPQRSRSPNSMTARRRSPQPTSSMIACFRSSTARESRCCPCLPTGARILRQPGEARELYLAIEDIDHSRIKTKSPQTIDKNFFRRFAVSFGPAVLDKSGSASPSGRKSAVGPDIFR